MGANNSTRRVSFESDENDNIAVVKGIRLSENVIKRMREPVTPLHPQIPPQPLVSDPSPLLLPVPSPFDQFTPIPPPAPPLKPIPSHTSPPSVNEAMAIPAPPPPIEQPPVEPASPTPPPPVESAAPPPSIEPVAPLPPVESAAPPPSIEPVAPPTPVESAAPPLHPMEPVTNSPPSVKSVTPSPPEELVVPLLSEPMPVAAEQPAAAPPPVIPTVDVEGLRKKITEELQKDLEQERSKAERELHLWLEKEKAQAAVVAQAEAQALVKDEVSRILTLERAMAQDTLQQAGLRQRGTTEDERLRVQIYAKQLENREAELKKQDAFYREQVAKMEDRSAKFYKVTTENYHKAADQINSKFKRYESSAVCADIQGQILKCYQENTGKTLVCSNIAALYLQCVNNAKQNKLRTGG